MCWSGHAWLCVPPSSAATGHVQQCNSMYQGCCQATHACDLLCRMKSRITFGKCHLLRSCLLRLVRWNIPFTATRFQMILPHTHTHTYVLMCGCDQCSCVAVTSAHAWLCTVLMCGCACAHVWLCPVLMWVQPVLMCGTMCAPISTMSAPIAQWVHLSTQCTCSTMALLLVA